MSRRAVAIVGGGIAGLACAFAAAKAGASVTLFEANAELRGEPVHVDVVPSMLRDLVGLGLGDVCVRAGFPYRRTGFIGPRSSRVFSREVNHLAGPRYPAALGISNERLTALLLDAAEGAGVQVRRGTRVEMVDASSPHEAVLQLASGDEVVAELAVIACGLKGHLRNALFEGRVVAPATDWFHALVRRPRSLDEPLHAVTPAGDRVQTVPVGEAQVGIQLAPRTGLDLHSQEAFRSLLGRFPNPIGELAAQIDASTTVLHRTIHPATLPTAWARGAAVAVGDCAHSLPANFGQSAAQAVEDSVVLGDLLARSSDIPTLLEDYLHRRLPRVQQVMEITTRAARWDSAPDSETDYMGLARLLEQMVLKPA